MSVLLGSSGASVILGSSGGGVVRRGSAKAALTEADFTYLGCFSEPTSVGGKSTDYGQGLTHRYVGGELRLFLTVTPNSSEVYEVTVPSTLSTGGTIDQAATLVRNWGDIYQSERYLYKASGTGDAKTIGLYWDETDQRLYWMYQDIYNASHGDDCCLGYSTLNDTTGVGTGVAAWRFVNGIGCKVVKGITPIPQAFADAYCSGRRLGVGFGTYESAATTGPASMGPALFAIDPPSTGTTTSRDYLPACTTLINHPFNSTAYSSPWRATRDTDYTQEFDTWDVNAGVGYFTWNDQARQSGVWLETTTKQGFLHMVTLGNARNWYETSDRHATRGTHRWAVYSIDQLASVAQSSITSHQVAPTNVWLEQHPHISYPLAGWDGEPPYMYAGTTFDSTTNRLYVRVRFGAIYVYSVAS